MGFSHVWGTEREEEARALDGSRFYIVPASHPGEKERASLSITGMIARMGACESCLVPRLAQSLASGDGVASSPGLRVCRGVERESGVSDDPAQPAEGRFPRGVLLAEEEGRAPVQKTTVAPSSPRAGLGECGCRPLEDPSDTPQPHATQAVLSALSSLCSDQSGTRQWGVGLGAAPRAPGLSCLQPSRRAAGGPELWSLPSSGSPETYSTSLVFHFPEAEPGDL